MATDEDDDAGKDNRERNSNHVSEDPIVAPPLNAAATNSNFAMVAANNNMMIQHQRPSSSLPHGGIPSRRGGPSFGNTTRGGRISAPLPPNNMYGLPPPPPKKQATDAATLFAQMQQTIHNYHYTAEAMNINQKYTNSWLQPDPIPRGDVPLVQPQPPAYLSDVPRSPLMFPPRQPRATKPKAPFPPTNSLQPPHPPTNNLQRPNMGANTTSNDNDNTVVDSSLELIEEDPLPATHTRIYGPILHRKRKWQESCSMVSAVVPRTIGSMHDNMHHQAKLEGNAANIFCRCKAMSCLQLYCECFAAAGFCSSKCICKSCSNLGILDSNNVANLHPGRRRRAIIDALMKEPQTAFRSLHPQPKCGNIFCNCFQAGIYCQQEECKCQSKCHKIPRYGKRYFYDPKANNEVTLLSKHNASAYTMPLKIRDVMAPGICFVRADPRLEADSSATQKPSSSQKLYHNLMLSPSKSIRSSHTRSVNRNQGTELERQWSEECNKLQSFFAQIHDLAETQLASEDISVIPEESTEATTMYKTAIADFEAVKNVMDAAKLDMMTVFYEQKKLGKYHYQNNAKKAPDALLVNLERDEDADADVKQLRCDEDMPIFPEAATKPPEDSDALQQLLIRTAQDTALMKETARIIRRKARELALLRARNVTV